MKIPKHHLLMIALLAGLLWPVRMDASNPKVSAALAPVQETFVLGEPVLVQARLRNESTEPVQIDFGSNFEGNVRFVVNGIDRPSPGLPPEGGFSSLGDVTLRPGESYSQRFLLDKWSRFEQAGQYQVRFVLDSVPKLEAVTTVVVEPRDPERLAKACAKLAQQAESYEAEPALLAAEALSYVGDEACLPALTEALQKSFHGKEGAIRGLLRIGTEPAIQALVDGWDKLRWDQQALVLNEAETHGRREELRKALVKAGKPASVEMPRDTPEAAPPHRPAGEDGCF
jgi:hypothetical protein